MDFIYGGNRNLYIYRLILEYSHLSLHFHIFNHRNEKLFFIEKVKFSRIRRFFNFLTEKRFSSFSYNLLRSVSRRTRDGYRAERAFKGRGRSG